MLGGAFGYGLNANIRDMYRFLVHNYRTGDNLYLFDFSRGAFTVRALANLLAICGIVKPDGDPKITEQRIADTLQHYHRWRAEIRKVEVDDEGQGPAKKAEEQPLEDRA